MELLTAQQNSTEINGVTHIAVDPKTFLELKEQLLKDSKRLDEPLRSRNDERGLTEIVFKTNGKPYCIKLK